MMQLHEDYQGNGAPIHAVRFGDIAGFSKVYLLFVMVNIELHDADRVVCLKVLNCCSIAQMYFEMNFPVCLLVAYLTFVCTHV